MEWGIYAGIAVLLIIVIGGWVVRSKEQKEWNRGVCPKCYSVWELRDANSQGARMYRCSGCGDVIWVSYNIDALVSGRSK